MRLRELMTDESLLIEIGSRLRDMRINANLRQNDLADKASISRSTVSKIERGKQVGVSEFLRYMRAIDLLESLDSVIWDTSMSPLKLASQQKKDRKRRRVGRARAPAGAPGEITWPEDN